MKQINLKSLFGDPVKEGSDRQVVVEMTMSGYTYPECVSKIETAMHEIASSFLWSSTPEGHEYWADVISKLSDIAISFKGRDVGRKT